MPTTRASMLAPIALFVYRRPQHTANCIGTLAACPEFRDSPLFIYADGAKSSSDAADVASVRAVIRDVDHPCVKVIEAKQNSGLAASVIRGVTQLCEEYGRVIVVEDDLLLLPTFLAYMNAGLEFYANQPEVMHVSGYSYGKKPLNKENRAILINYTHPWGWGTWNRAWALFDQHPTSWLDIVDNPGLRKRFDLGGVEPNSRILTEQMTGRSDSWWIRWHLTVFRRQGVGLFPPATTLENDGFGGTATHSALSDRLLSTGRRDGLSCLPEFPSDALRRDTDMAAFVRGMRPRARRLIRTAGSLRRAFFSPSTVLPSAGQT